MKFDIKWHEQCLMNRRANIQKDMETAEREQKRISKELRDIEFYASQISTAKENGKDGFDDERYLVKRNTKEKP